RGFGAARGPIVTERAVDEHGEVPARFVFSYCALDVRAQELLETSDPLRRGIDAKLIEAKPIGSFGVVVLYRTHSAPPSKLMSSGSDSMRRRSASRARRIRLRTVLTGTSVASAVSSNE